MNQSQKESQIELFDSSTKGLLSKTNIRNKVAEFETAIQEGYISALDVKVWAKTLEETSKSINESPIIKEAAIKEAEQYGKQDIIIKDATLRVGEVGNTYDYSNSPAWVSVKAEIEMLTQILKDIEALARNTKIVVQAIDHNGELLDVYPAIKKSSTTVTVSLKK